MKNQQLSPKELCIKGETLACKFLKKRGFKILKRNHLSKYGEIDIIAFCKGTISFVEVKTRQSEYYGSPELAVTREKRKRIIRTALNYLIVNHVEEVVYRFDVVSILFKEDDRKPDMEFFESAFTADGVVSL
jgi:putative endonuclease